MLYWYSQRQVDEVSIFITIHWKEAILMIIIARSPGNRSLYQLTPVAWWQGGLGGRDNFLGALKSKGGAKIYNCQCEILYKICKVQLVNKFKVVVILAFL